MKARVTSATASALRPGRVQDRNAVGGAGRGVDVDGVPPAGRDHAQIRQARQRGGVDQVDLGDEDLHPVEGAHQIVAREQPQAGPEARVLDVAQLAERVEGVIGHIGRDENAGAEGGRGRLGLCHRPVFGRLPASRQ